jgi:hypothetical protein
VIALEQNLVATADAHQLMTEFVETRRRITGAGEGADGKTEQGALQRAAEERIGFRRHFCRPAKSKATGLRPVDSPFD